MATPRLRELLKTDDWLVVDTETTGRGERAEAVELAAVDPRGEVIFESLIRPTVRVSEGAARVHGLTAERLAFAPRLGEIYEDLHAVLAGRVLVAYYAAFDRRVLASSCARARLPTISAEWQCALDFYESLRAFRPPLATACEIEEVEMPATRHRAAADAEALRRLLVKLREEV